MTTEYKHKIVNAIIAGASAGTRRTLNLTIALNRYLVINDYYLTDKDYTEVLEACKMRSGEFYYLNNDLQRRAIGIYIGQQPRVNILPPDFYTAKVESSLDIVEWTANGAGILLFAYCIYKLIKYLTC